AMRDLVGMLELRPAGAPDVEIVRMVASRAEGIGELAAAIDRHATHMRGTADGERRAVRRAGAQLMELLEERFLGAVEGALARRGGLDRLARDIAGRTLDPYSAADEVAAVVLAKNVLS